jgi:NTP pyrophosphatase (non-canonical NTP hydrolase)
MTTEHFNGLTEAEAERLAILIEECGEVTQAACKILRHGYDSNNKGQMPETNREALARELGDVVHSINRMTDAKDIDGREIGRRAASKPEHIRKYLHHQGAENG